MAVSLRDTFENEAIDDLRDLGRSALDFGKEFGYFMIPVIGDIGLYRSECEISSPLEALGVTFGTCLAKYGLVGIALYKVFE